ncbi:MAG TPA: HD domain-containing phosphohydrolase [Capsulimonadaceae bacterium]|nr:HD domain-containing phosphohydrolase [Capsulimonadaceae bacterium]
MTVFQWVTDIIGATGVSSAFLVAFAYLPWMMGRATRQSYIAMARAVEAREPHLIGHAEQTARYVVAMAWLSLRFSPRQIRSLESAALLHTIGKVGVPFDILNRPTPPSTTSDRFALRDYVRISAAIIGAVPGHADSAEMVRFHREYMDGSGYPHGRYGHSIPLGARLLCVATEFVALTSPRVYRGGLPALSPDNACTYLWAYSGERYDRHAVRLLVFCYRAKKLFSLLRPRSRPRAAQMHAAVTE